MKKFTNKVNEKLDRDLEDLEVLCRVAASRTPRIMQANCMSEVQTKLMECELLIQQERLKL